MAKLASSYEYENHYHEYRTAGLAAPYSALDQIFAANNTYKRMKDLATADIAPEETPQATIDRKLKEALEEPRVKAEEERQAAEVARRIELANKIGNNDQYAFGAVLTWTRRLNDKSYSYAALKAGDGNWYVTGAHQARSSGWKFHDLVEWMLTGENTVENLKINTGWEDIF